MSWIGRHNLQFWAFAAGALLLSLNARLRPGSGHPAEAWYRTAVSVDPGYAVGWYDLGALAEQSNRLAEARDDFKRAADLEPHDPAPLREWAELSRQLGDTDGAIAALQRLTAEHPRDAESHHRLGVALHAGGRDSEAIVELERTQALEPDATDVLLQLGALYGSAQKYELAAQTLERAVSQDPGSAPAWFDLGIARKNLGKRASAIDALTRAIAAQPDYLRAYSPLIELELQDGQRDRARAHAQRLLELDPDNATASALLSQTGP
ncbi:MAG: tetratricopeptide repeat protein [Deltaproteobacteria bacterium]|nr:tetratricopeptide repeat protein [Deltaproteobacteria bacterium]